MKTSSAGRNTQLRGWTTVVTTIGPNRQAAGSVPDVDLVNCRESKPARRKCEAADSRNRPPGTWCPVINGSMGSDSIDSLAPNQSSMTTRSRSAGSRWTATTPKSSRQRSSRTTWCPDRPQPGQVAAGESDPLVDDITLRDNDRFRVNFWNDQLLADNGGGFDASDVATCHAMSRRRRPGCAADLGNLVR